MGFGDVVSFPGLFPRDSCVTCDGSTPTCDCATGEQCVLTSRTCAQCPSIQCIKSSSSSSGGAINPGVIAGPVVAVLVIASLALFWYLRRKKRRDLARLEELAARARKAESAGFHLSHPGTPPPRSATSSAHTRRSRASQLPPPPPSARRQSQRSPLPPAPVNAEYYDENGATMRVYGGDGTINLDPNHPDNGGSGDPFSDGQSISTNGSRATGQSTNIIPIQWIPPSSSDDTLSRFFHASRAAGGMGDAAGGRGTADRDDAQMQAARTLDEARQNLFRPKATPPQRPARAPGLDLRAPDDGRVSPYECDDRSPPIQPPGRIRDSYLSEVSGSPSFLSGTSDVHLDAPKIVTSKQVPVGRLQQAEVVQWGAGSSRAMDVMGQNAKLSPVSDTFDDGFEGRAGSNPSRLSPALTVNTGLASRSDASSGSSGGRRLTPSSASHRFSDPPDGEHEVLSGASDSVSGDLRFSMGSLAYRDSMSSMGTSRYLARPESAAVPPPRGTPSAQMLSQPRESMLSNKSAADSVLSAFPMIPPNSLPPPVPSYSIPQSSSAATLDSVARPPPSYKPVASAGRGVGVPSPAAGSARGGTTPGKRPETATSVADSFLGSFPFVPPNVDDLADLPSAAMPTAAVPDTAAGGKASGPAGAPARAKKVTGAGAPGRNTLGMSTTSEGLGGFEFRVEGAPPLPERGGG